MTKKVFISGISTDVGKTVVSAIVVEALKADYWKPVQAGDLEFSDTDRVKAMVSNTTTVYHPNAYGLNTPMSPHAAAEIDGVKIDVKKIVAPQVDNEYLVVEGAGGLLVPLNDTDTVLDLIAPKSKVILVSRNYLGSINHTLLSIAVLQQKGCEVGVLFNGNEVKTTQDIILKKTGVTFLGRIEEEKELTKEVIVKYAEELIGSLVSFLTS